MQNVTENLKFSDDLGSTTHLKQVTDSHLLLFQVSRANSMWTTIASLCNTSSWATIDYQKQATTKSFVILFSCHLCCKKHDWCAEIPLSCLDHKKSLTISASFGFKHLDTGKQ